jgi:hypothetical protein
VQRFNNSTESSTNKQHHLGGDIENALLPSQKAQEIGTHVFGSEQVLVAEQPDFDNYGFLALNKPLFRSPHIIKESII